MKLQVDGEVVETEFLDINVWFDGDAVRLTLYPAHTGTDGYRETNTSKILVSAETDFWPENYEDEWYDWDDLTLPNEVSALVRGILKEIEV